MSKPDDIPQDVWDAAAPTVALIFDQDGIFHTNLHARIARVILTAKAVEREACALIADKYVDSIDIAHFIRKRSEG